MSAQSELTLFQRIALGEEGAKKQLTLDPDKLRQSIGLHLQNMFNTRQGSAMANDDYGLPDFNDLDMSDGFTSAMNGVKKAIKQHLDKYETRLSKVRVNYIENDDDPLDLRFEIKAQLNIKGHRGKVRFEAYMLGDGPVKVTS